MGIRQDFLRGVAETLINQTYDVCSRWAVKRRVMQDGEAYSLADYPYVEGILNSRAKKNWVMKGAQTGLTEAGITIGLYEIDYHQRDVIHYFPTGKMAERFSKTRFTTAIKLSPYLKRAVVNDSLEIKQIGNATLHVLGANSMANLKGTSSGRLILDELDEWTEKQIYLAEERASGQKNDDKIIWGLSTPKYPNTGIHKQYLQSTQEHFFFDCPHCQEEIELVWEDSFVLCGENVDDPAVHDSYLKCSKCQAKLDHATKKQWLSTGRWKATNPDSDPTLSRGFHVSQLYSPTVSPGELAVAYLRGSGDEDARREFHNSKLGLPYIEEAYQVNDQQIDAAIRKYSMVTARPTKATDGFFTLGIDQGGALHHWVAVSWKFDATRYGDPNDRAIGKVVGCGRVPQDDWASIHGLMRGYQVRMCVIDYFPEPTAARIFARKFNGFVYLAQYVKGTAAREVRPTEDEYGANIVRCDRVSWLSKSLGRVMSGDMEFPLDLPLEFRQHIKAPVRSLKNVDGTYVAEYVETGPDHYAHAMTYAEIALKIADPALSSGDTLTKIR